MLVNNSSKRKLKILLVHNFYGSESPSGENAVVNAEKRMLEANEHQVNMFSTSSDEIRGQGVYGLIKGGLSTAWNPRIFGAIKEKIETFGPDVVHVHNTFPLISPAVFYAINSQIPKVLTVHNYRLFCPSGIPMRNGLICTQCLDQKNVLPAVVHGCYRESHIATVPLAFSVELHRKLGTWSKKVDGFITLTHFQKDKLSRAGLPLDKMYVKANSATDHLMGTKNLKKHDHVVFVGRLGQEKGLVSLLQAWKLMSLSGIRPPELRLIGDGPLLKALKEMAGGLPISFLGQVSSAKAIEEIAQAKLLILPSICFEAFPMVVCEAFAQGTPVAASNIGSLPEIVKENICGALFEPGDSRSICTVVSNLWSNQDRLQKLSIGARKEYEKYYTEKTNYSRLVEIYEDVINKKYQEMGPSLNYDS